MDNATRKLIQDATQSARKLLERDYREQLEGTYDILLDGQIAPQPGAHLDARQRLLRQKLAGAIQHKIEKGLKADAAVADYLREAAFTTLNRFVALKMLEARALVQECISRGEQSSGFREFGGLAPGLVTFPDHGYRLYLECLFDEIGREVRVLFDRRDEASLLWPRRQALNELLDTLNAPELGGVWAEDETIGWVYQYFNSQEERRKMRDDSAAPRNSHELAVRNQFFTPRYVVQFLTDNTLGRTWYEMRKGDTALTGRCQYLVRRPDEVMPQRQKKDPRQLKVLDPACGSGHFLLYCFDLLQAIYEEAYRDDSLGAALERDYPDFAEFQRAVPELILRHNLHGLDIDARCAQIAALALWMRAQRAYRELGLKPAERPRIKQINIVCAEPMPGEQDLLDEFIAVLPTEVPGELVRSVFERMKLAGEAGSLLRIEDDISEPIARAKEEWNRLQQPGQPLLFDKSLQSSLFDLAAITDERFWDIAGERVHNALREYARRASVNLTNGQSFQRRLFAEDALQGFDFIDLLRQKFDVVLMNPPFGDTSLPSKRYIDETYGDTKGDVYKAFVECFQDRLVPGGMLGIISSRTGFFLGQSADWRQRVVLRLYRPLVLLDLGMGVLDAMVETAAYVLRSLTEAEDRELTLSLAPELARVPVDKNDCFSTKKYETLRDLKRHQATQELQRLRAAGFITPMPGSFPRWSPQREEMERVQVPPPVSYPLMVCLRLLGEEDKAGILKNTISQTTANLSGSNVFITSPSEFRKIHGSTFAYWVGTSVRKLFTDLPPFESYGRFALGGLKTLGDERFIRAWWELQSVVLKNKQWAPLAKGGAFSRFYVELPLMVNWKSNGTDISLYGYQRRPREGFGGANRGIEAYFRPGITWPRRTNGLSFRLLPSGCIFGDKGPAAFVLEDSPLSILATCAILNSQVFGFLISLQLARTELAQSYEVGIIQQTPFPETGEGHWALLADFSLKSWSIKRSSDSTTETSHSFALPAIVQFDGSHLNDCLAAWSTRLIQSEHLLAALQREIDDIAFRLYSISDEDRKSIERFVNGTQTTLSSEDEDNDEEEAEQPSTDHRALTANLLSYALGCAFGRWDVRFATGEKQPPPLPDPFAPLPVCAPGALQGADGLPITSPEQLTTDHYPLTSAVAWDGALVDDEGHPKDLLAAVRAVFETIWPEHADDRWREAADLLGAPGGDVRAWFRKSFFEEHKKRYSKSRRKAPIYWQLATPSASYSVWLYYHRFSPDTFYGVLQTIKDKLDHEELKLAGLRRTGGDAPTRSQRTEIEAQESFVAELRTMREEVERIAPLWNPNLNDGVIINFAPLWRLAGQHRAWQKECRDCWEKLSAGDYDWAHLAMHLWPERVVPKCRTDASLAIAHGLETEFWQQDEKGKWQPKETDAATVNRLIAERSSPSVKAALESLQKAPTAQNRAARRRAIVIEPSPSVDAAPAPKRRSRTAKPKPEPPAATPDLFEGGETEQV